MTLANLGELRGAIEDTLARNDLQSLFPGAVRKFESKFNTAVRIAEMEVSAELTVVGGIATLQADSDSNWLLLGYPHLYEYGVSAELGIPLQDSSIIQINKALYESALAELKDADLGRRWGGASIVLTSPTP
jgi:hypothetical protein